jgi:DNA-binding transcriptional ArsR family regulator
MIDSFLDVPPSSGFQALQARPTAATVRLQYNDMYNAREKRLKALANGHRLQILSLLKESVRNFPPQVDGDLVKDGVCAVLIEEKLGLAQPTTAQHLKALVDSGFLISKRIKRWTFYKRDERAIANFLKDLKTDV